MLANFGRASKTNMIHIIANQHIPSIAITILPADISVAELAGRLRQGVPAVVGYIRDDHLHLDMRTIAEHEVADLIGALRAAANA